MINRANLVRFFRGSAVFLAVFLCALGSAKADSQTKPTRKPRLIGFATILPTPKFRVVSTKPLVRKKPGQFPSYAEAMLQPIYLGSVDTDDNQQQLRSSDVTATLNEHLDEIYASCITKELQRSSINRLQLQIAIESKGKVVGASVDPGSKIFQKCVIGIVKDIKFASFSAPRMGAEYKLRIEP